MKGKGEYFPRTLIKEGIKMADKKSNESRRKLLKSIAAGGGAVIAGKSLPEKWSRPVVDSVMLPAHAVTSLVEQYTSLISAQTENDSLFANALDGLVPEAQAQRQVVREQTCISLNPDGSVMVDGLIFNRRGLAYQVTASPVWIGAEPAKMNLAACQRNQITTTVKVTDISDGIARGYYLLDGPQGGDKVDFYCPAGACSAPACPLPPINCLAHDTHILTPGNNNRVIDSLQVGDIVTGIDQDGTSIYTVVTKVITQHIRTDFYTINGDLRITDDHPVLVTRDQSLVWCRVDQLVVGDQIRSINGYIDISSLEYRDQPLETVYVETQCGNFIAMAGSEYYVVKSNYAEDAERLQQGEVKTFA
jgi:hypothetical protein